MRIDSNELCDFKRMALNDITRFKITPSERIQLILGTNGSGKSSLMSELSPLPAVASNYGKKGYKVITVTHRGEQYILTSSFNPTQKHSIVKIGKDGLQEELNPGGTITVQKDIVKSIFGYTPDIHDLLTGVEKFSLMSPSRRRQWLTDLCEVSYDYAIGVYNKVAERSRDTSGALKLAKKRLVVETSKIVSQDELDKIQLDIQGILREIDLLYNSRTEESRCSGDIEVDQEMLENEIKQLAEKLFNVKGLFANRLIFSPQELSRDMEFQKHEITKITTQIDIATKAHGELKEKYDTFAKTGALGLGDLKKRFEDLSERKAELQAKKKLNLILDNPRATEIAFDSISDTLHHVFHNLPENKDRLFSQQNLQAAKQEEFDIKEKIERAQRILSELNHQKLHLEQLRDGQSTECPNCNHKWIPGFNQKHYEKIGSEIDVAVDFLTKTQNRLTVVKKSIEDNTAYGDLFREYMRCVRSVGILTPLWELLSEQIYDSPMACFRQTELFRNDLSIDIQCLDIDDEIKRNDHLIELAVKANDLDIGQISKKIEEIENNLGDLTFSLKTSRDKLQACEKDYNRVAELNALSMKIGNCWNLLDIGVHDLVKATRNEIINQCLNQLQIELAQKQNRLNEIRLQHGIVKDIESSIEKLTKEEETLKILANTLSPHDGLIAEGLLGFIRNYVRKMNTLIRKIWTYKLEVQDCGIDSDMGAELDYKFPMIVGSDDNVIPDVSKGSTGMREIIDLSFKIVAMQYLDLADFPLFADELGHAMDSEHKAGTVNLIKYLTDHGSFSQIWMISHDYMQFGALSNTEICVLSPDNILVPKHHNEHVEMS